MMNAALILFAVLLGAAPGRGRIGSLSSHIEVRKVSNDISMSFGPSGINASGTLSFTRASQKYCSQDDGTVTILANNAPCVVGDKILIEGPSQNFLGLTDDIGNATLWTNTNVTISADSSLNPWGTTTMDTVTSTVGSGKSSQTVSLTSSTGPFTLSAIGRAVSGTHTAALGFTCTGSTPATCTCFREDGTSCTTTVSGAECGANSSFSSTVTHRNRIQVRATCNAAITSTTVSFGGGDYFGGVTGSHIWGAGQFEVRKYATSYMPRGSSGTATRAADVPRVATSGNWPINEGAVGASIIPLWGSAGTPQGDVAGILGHPDNIFPAAGWTFAVYSSGALVSDVRNNGASFVLSDLGLSFTHGTTYFMRQTMTPAGVIKYWRNGSVVSVTGTHPPASMPIAIKSVAQIGGFYNGYIDGWVKSFCVSKSTNGCMSPVSPPFYSVLWLSDSIYNSDFLASSVIALNPTYSMIAHRGTYSGQVVGAGLLEMADKSYAFTNGSWALQSRAAPFGLFDAMVFVYGRNDATTGENVAEFRKAYDKILAQAKKNGIPRVVSGTPPPQALGDFSAWSPTDPYEDNGYRSAVNALATKWNSRHVDNFANFKTDVTNGTVTIAQVMYDTLHPTNAGASRIAASIQAALSASTTLNSATPEIAGEVVNYLFGAPSAGTWALTPVVVGSMPPTVGPLARIAGLSDLGQQASATGAKLSFPSTQATQLWLHFWRMTSGGTIDVYIDRGTAQQVKVSLNTGGGIVNYPSSQLIGSNLSAGEHVVEIETTSNGPVSILGVTVVKP